MKAQLGEGPARSLARLLGAANAWVLPVSAVEVLERLRFALGEVELAIVEPLYGSPVACLDFKAAAAQARGDGKVLIADVSLMGPAGCAAVRLGARVAVAGYEGTWCVVGVERALLHEHPDLRTWLDATAGEPLSDGCDPEACLEAQTRRWHATSDAAQVVAAYLRCHPRVVAVRYPGLKSDPSFAVAARTLTGGFGPLVDYRLACEDGWRRTRCTDEDPRAQVMRLEALLG